MNKIKLEYEAPEVNTLEVKFEGNLLAGSDGSWDNSIKNGSTWNTDDEDYGLE